MTPNNKKYHFFPFNPSFFAAAGIMKRLTGLKTILSVFRFLKPAHRKFHSRKEMEAFKHIADIKKNSGLGPGPPM